MLNSEFSEFTKNAHDYYPAALRDEINNINTLVYSNINNGVYKCGFAKSQQAYDRAFHHLFNTLDAIDDILSTNPYLVGNELTEADIRVFTTLVRFDLVYYFHFKCNLKRIIDYPNIWRYLQTLYKIPEIKITVHFDDIKTHYYRSQLTINPMGIIALGPPNPLTCL